MYKLIIIDDEKIILDNLSKAIKWSNYGFELSATFSVSQQAIDYLKKHPVDLVITDIKMPEISGLDIAKIIHENYPDIYCVILTAYNEFEFAKEAIRLDVKDYLSKPISFKELENTLTTLKIKLDDELNNKTIIKELSYFKIQKTLNEYLQSPVCSLSTLCDKMANLGIPVSVFENYVCRVQVEFEDFQEYLLNTWAHGKEKFYSAFNRISSYENLYFIPLSYDYDKIDAIILTEGSNENNIYLVIEKYKEYLVSQSFEILNIITNIYSTGLYKNIDDFKSANISNNLIYDKSKEFTSLVLSGNEKAAFEFLNQLLKDSEIEYIKTFAHASVNEISKAVHIDIKNILPHDTDSIDKINTKTKFKELFSKLIYSALKKGYEPKYSGYDALEAAKSYINEHYSENVTLTDVANHVAFSPSHFSRYFKKETGMNFINYLNKVRIEKATELLVNTRFKVHEICKMVGYIAPMYFYKVFKQHTGYTAQEYRNKFSNPSSNQLIQ